MITETARLARLADGLLAVARAEAVAPAPEPSDVGAVAAERVAAWQPIAAERGLVLKLVRSRTARALITPGHLEQALDNVLANAVEAVGDGGRVTVTVENADAGRAAREVVVRVADDGPGMPEELRARAFERFVADRATGGGTGLGLAIAGRLVAADHGSALLRETPGGGLTVEFFLPVADRSERHRPAPAAPDEPASADAVDSDQASRA
jgi:signal transduction histidine kinase